MYVMYKFFTFHNQYHDYLTKIMTCGKSGCMVCPKFGNYLCTSRTKNENLQDTLLCPIYYLVVDTCRVGHFVLPEKAQALIV